MFTKFLDPNGIVNKLIAATKSRQNITVFGLGNNEKMWLINEAASFTLFVTYSEKQALYIHEKFVAMGKKSLCLTAPVSYENTSFKSLEMKNLIQALTQLSNDELEVLVVYAPIILTKLPSKNKFLEQRLVLETGKKYSLSNIKKQLVCMGYKNVEKVESEFEFKSVGDALTVFVGGKSHATKIDFFDDEIENIKNFDVNNINENKTISHVLICGQNLISSEDFNVNLLEEKLLKEAKNHKLKESEKAKLNTIITNVLLNISNGFVPDWILPYFNFENNLLDYLPNNSCIAFEEPKQILDAIHSFTAVNEECLSEQVLAGNLCEFHKNSAFLSANSLKLQDKTGLISFQQIITANNLFQPMSVFNIKTGTLVNYLTNKQAFYNDIKSYQFIGYTILLFVKSKELQVVIESELNKNKLGFHVSSLVSMAQKSTINLIAKYGLTSACFAEEKLLIVGTDNFVKKQNILVSSNKNNNETINKLFTLPKAGDYVVHHTHGIGKCENIVSMTFNNLTKDYIEIVYKNADKLFLPVENLDSITRYIGKELPTLNKLGGSEFAKVKQSVRASLKVLTVNLKALYKNRLEKVGIHFPADDEIQNQFENAFPFTETPDQLTAINDMKSDMTSSKVMDRLICGDVGYGKTEVALRGIFKAVMAGYQVMFLCPTTILSQQHFNTCVARMQSFGIRVEVLNRFKSVSQQKQILSDLKNGKVDVLCGTHRLLSNDVVFKRLGMLVLDEEQKFGVEHKEKIKNLKSDIDVLTLSATPIPRTMNMSLVGIKDISVISTPPSSRIPVITKVIDYQDEFIKTALLNEIERGGQAMVIYNRVEKIYEVAKHISSLVGQSVVVDVAHGQMPEHLLENAILKLYQNETQILVSTTLIENGIDLPNANTLIVINADKLGLSQLYQLKGRVGRSERQAYAYFTFHKSKVLTENGYKRLEAIMEFSGLGNGFKIALRDLEIRGAGSIFGGEQSGHMEKVGYNMYLTLLNEEVNGKESKVLFDVKIEYGKDANLPNYYIEKTEHRMETYHDISKLRNLTEKNELLEKLDSTYGKVPENVMCLCDVAIIKNLAQECGVVKVSIKNDGGKILFESVENLMQENVVKITNKYGNNFVLNLESLPIINININNNIEKLTNILISYFTSLVLTNAKK